MTMHIIQGENGLITKGRDFAMTKTQQMLLLTLWFILVGCARLVPTAAPVVISPNPTATPIPTDAPPPTVSPAPPLASTPVVESSWQCYQGGIACYDDLFDVSMLNAEEGWAVGYDNVVLHYTTHSGQATPTWQQVYPFQSSGVLNLKIKTVGPNEWWGLHHGSLVHYQDGQTQEYVIGLVEDFAVVDKDEIWVAGEGHISHYRQGKVEEVWLIGSENDIVHYRPEEAEITLSGPRRPNIGNISMLNATEGWATVNGYRLLHYENGVWEYDISFSDVANDKSIVINDMVWLDDDEAWFVGTHILHYVAGAWELTANDLGAEETRLSAISMINREEGWAVGRKGYIMHYQNGTWQAVESPTQKQLYAIDMVSSTEGWAVGEDSIVLYYHNGIWEVVSEAMKPPEMIDIDWVDDEGWAVGVNGAILHYKDDQWQSVVSPTNLNLNTVDMVTGEEGWAGGWKGTMLHYTQGQWQLVRSSVTEDINDIDMVNEQEGWAVGNRGKIIHYNAGEWREVTSPTEKTLSKIDMVNEQEGWVLGRKGTILHYQDGIWQENPSILEKNFQIEMINEIDGWILGSEQGERIILRYDGKDWQPIKPPSGYSLTTMDMLNSEEGWFMGEEGILHYQSGEWEIFNNPARGGMRIVMLNENEGWAVGGGILHYTNE